MDLLDSLLNRLTMYRLTVYVLLSYVGLGMVFALLGRLSATATEMVISLFILFVTAYTTDRGLARLFHVPTNMESWLITALILFLIVQPANSTPTYLALGLAGALSMASKFLLARSGKHLFNPAALAASFLSLWGLLPVTWWIGSTLLWPFTLLLGLLVIRKIKRAPLFLSFAITSILLQYLLFLQAHQPLFVDMRHALLASPLIFLSTIMLTEPATMPPRRNQQIIFGVLVALLYVTAWKLGPLIIYPEIALLIGNIYAYFVSPKYRFRLQLKEIQQISNSVYNYVFLPDRRFSFIPGQYMEWTLAGVPYDSRGNRRTFTIASSPTENEVQIGLKYHEPASAYKAAFHDMQPGDLIYASQLAGNFTLHGDEQKRLAFIAGGVGITPFRSMIKYLTDNDVACDIVLLYVVSNDQEFLYAKEFTDAAKIGVKVIPIVTKPGKAIAGVLRTKINPSVLVQLLPDYGQRKFYISGPNVMVDATKNHLRTLGVANKLIKTDHFSGY